MGDSEALRVRVETAMRNIPAAAWDACAGGGKALQPDSAYPYNPFLSHAFLSTLEDAGCVRAQTGWLPQHLIVEDGKGGVAACMPCYLKGHSQGEYVFDHGWADAFERAGGEYYPKLQAAVPFTPVPGQRLLVRPDLDSATYRRVLANAGLQLMQQVGASSLHVTFLSKEEWRQLGHLGFLQRMDHQFHWLNQGYATFDDFLNALAARKRKGIRKERREAREHGLKVEWLTGRDITEAHWDAFFAFYMDTGSRKWGRPYLNRRFFSLAGERMADDILLVLANRGGRHVAGALNFIGSDTLYGRYWGCSEDHPFLHFEVCYYQAIDYAIAHSLKHVEAGAQGPHKLARGYVPVPTYSSHYIAHQGLRDAVAHYLDAERQEATFEARLLGRHAPFKKAGDGTVDAPLDPSEET